MAYINLLIKTLLLLFITVFAFMLPTQSKASNVELTIFQLSNKIVDARVQISSINEYMKTLHDKIISEKKHLKQNFNTLTTSISILYKLKTTPKETLLLQHSLKKNQIFDLYMIINYWMKYALTKINSLYVNIKAIKQTTKDLNLAKSKLLVLDKVLSKNKLLLKKVAKSSNVNLSHIYKVNKIRHNLQYTSSVLKNNASLLAKVGLKALTPSDIKKDNTFIKKYKGKMFWPVNGYVYSYYKDHKYYNIYYYGLQLIALPHSKIYAPANGEVIFSGDLDMYHNVLIIKYSPSFISIISGKFTPEVRLAEKVHKQQELAKVGNITQSIYFELDKRGNSIDPIGWLEKKKGK